MNGRSPLRVALGLAMAIACAASGPVLAAPTASATTARIAPATVQTATTCTPGAAACPIRIGFARGWYSGQAHSTLTGIRSVRWFVVHARAGQVLIIIVKGAGPTRGIVYRPNGTSSGQPGGRVFDSALTMTGDYRIRVTESPMGQAWSGGVTVVAVAY